MKWKRTDDENAKAVREQVFQSKYKSEPITVESCFYIFTVLPVLPLGLFQSKYKSEPSTVESCFYIFTVLPVLPLGLFQSKYKSEPSIVVSRFHILAYFLYCLWDFSSQDTNLSLA